MKKLRFLEFNKYITFNYIDDIYHKLLKDFKNVKI